MADFAQRRVMMVDTQVRPNDVTKYPVIEAMLNIPREAFVPPSRRAIAYSGENIEIGGGRVELEPRTLAKMVDGLNIVPSDLVLCVGAGLGYSAAVVARMAEAVIALEQDADMVAAAQEVLTAEGIDNVAVLEGPLAEGCAKQGPYDVILICGGVEEIPAGLTGQLKEGGRIAALFCEGALGVVRFGLMLDGRVSWRFAFNAHAPVLPGFEAARGFAL